MYVCESALESDFGVVLGVPSRRFASSKSSDGDDVLVVDFLQALASVAEASSPPPTGNHCSEVP